MPINEKILSILACPTDKNSLSYKTTKTREYLQCSKCKTKYPIENNIPILLPKTNNEG